MENLTQEEKIIALSNLVKVMSNQIKELKKNKNKLQLERENSHIKKAKNSLARNLETHKGYCYSMGRRIRILREYIFCLENNKQKGIAEGKLRLTILNGSIKEWESIFVNK